MMEPADARKCDDRASAPRLDRACDGRVAIERHVRSVLVAIGDLFADLAEQMPLPQHDEVIEDLAS
jgi:hypothetical protein